MKLDDPAQRSKTMSAVRSTDTKPELLVRKLAHSLGYRYRLHQSQLPGKPDLVFPGRKKIIFVHGCFWHGHDCKRGARKPATRQDYWLPKIERNRQRDEAHLAALTSAGWRVMILWECELKDREALAARLTNFLEDRPTSLAALPSS